jgi:hypothetical protein
VLFAVLNRKFGSHFLQSWKVRQTPSQANIVTKIAGYDDKESNTKITSLILEAEGLQRQLDNNQAWVGSTNRTYESTTSDAKSQGTITGSVGDDINMKRGVTLSHKRHQEVLGSCTVCHSNSSGGSIAGFGKDWSHKTCKGCHSEMRQGPTKCDGCHSKK